MTRVLFRKIEPGDNAAVARIITSVMPEFGAGAPGFALHDEEVQNMSEAFNRPRSAYFVCDVNSQVLGGGGIAPLSGGSDDTCELKKMYFLPQLRGQGYGKQLLMICLAAAREKGFRYCYLETFHTMKSAISMYEENGFRRIPSSLGSTGHFGCDTFFILDL
jgi:putative acetyltransferase